jgi:hypothetical protein
MSPKAPRAGIGVERPALEIPYDELDVRDQIGGGGFSLVYRAFWKGDSPSATEHPPPTRFRV